METLKPKIMRTTSKDNKLFEKIWYFFALNGYHNAFYPDSFNKEVELEIIVESEKRGGKLSKAEKEFIEEKIKFLRKEYGGTGFLHDNNEWTQKWTKEQTEKFKRLWLKKGKEVPNFA